MKPTQASRRLFLAQAGALGAACAAPFALNLAGFGASARAGANDYKALVCIFLNGGNDGFNTVLPTDAESWTHYTAARDESPEPINLLMPGTLADGSASAGSPAKLGGCLAINPTRNQGRSFALHPCLSQSQSLFGTGKLAIVANAGPLLSPTSKADYAKDSFPKPAKLYSHNDQQSTWQSFTTEGSTAGWGGRMADLLASANGTHQSFTAISANGNAVFLAGQSVIPYQVGTSGPSRIGGNGQTALFGSTKAFQNMQLIASGARGSRLLEIDAAAVASRSIAAEAILSSALPASAMSPFGTGANPDPLLQYANPLTGKMSSSNLASQLQIIARMIAAAQTLGIKRQVFFASIGGFDTHDNQNKAQADNLAKLDHGLAYMQSMMVQLGLDQSVTTFTMSDFGRTFTSNGDGTDHGWGNHHFVVGGAVKGGDIYGAFPQFGPSDGKGGFNSPDQLQSGILLPSTSVDQYAATLGAWFGVPSGDLAMICPHLNQFSNANLGFI